MELQKIIRNYFRIAISEEDRVTIKADGHDYAVIDVGNRGVGIRLTEEDILLNKNDNLDVEIMLGANKLHLKGKVAHISIDDTGQYLCGIEFIQMDKKSKQGLLDYLNQTRRKFFANNSPDE